MNALIEVKNVTKIYKHTSGDRVAVKNLSFDLKAGEFLAILGPSGCGKTTLMRMICGLEQPDEGEIFYKGIPRTEPSTSITMVFQNYALLPWKTARENITLALESLGLAKEQKNTISRAWLTKVGLINYENSYPSELSGGMKQRIGIARALAVSPDIVLLDEPFSSLDEITTEDLQKLIYDIWLETKHPESYILITHLIEEAVLMSDRILILAPGGRIIGEVTNTLGKPRFSMQRKSEFYSMCDRVREIIRQSTS